MIELNSPSPNEINPNSPLVHWEDPGLAERDGVKSTVYELDFSRDGQQLVVACANLVLVYDIKEGDLVHKLKGHKADVYSVSFIRDATRFASGGADKTVIIWSNKGEGVLKYTHNDSIQKVSYNQATDQLVSCTANDFGLWSKEQKSVSKHKVFPRVLSCAWSNDGKHLALGHEDGKISLRDNKGSEKHVVERKDPIFCLAWAPIPPSSAPSSAAAASATASSGGKDAAAAGGSEVGEVLAVGCWDQTLSFYTSDGKPHLKARKLHFYPCSLSYLTDGEFMVIGGSDKRATLCTKEAVRLCTISEKEDWVWSVKAQPYPLLMGADNLKGRAGVGGGGVHATPMVATGCYGGSISALTLNFGLVSSLHKDRYAFRSNMTDVVVQHLPTEKQVRVKCRDYIKNVAVYHGRLAVQLPDRINIWELSSTGTNPKQGGELDLSTSSGAVLAMARSNAGGRGRDKDGVDMHYRLRKEKLFVSSPVSQLLVLARHVVLVHEKKIAVCLFECGDTRNKEREWIFDFLVTCVVADGVGPLGREALLVGLENGQVFKVLIDNPFPITLVEGGGAAVTCLSTSANRSKLAVVDSDEKMVVYELQQATAQPAARTLPSASPSALSPQAPEAAAAPSSSSEGAAGGRRGGRQAAARPTALTKDGAITMDGIELEKKKAVGSGGSSGGAGFSGGLFLNGGHVLFTEPHATHACFNSEVEESLCFSGNGTLSIKTGFEFPTYALQRVEGNVVGFEASKMYVLGGERLSVPLVDEDDEDEDEDAEEEATAAESKSAAGESKGGESSEGESKEGGSSGLSSKAKAKAKAAEEKKAKDKKKRKALLDADPPAVASGALLASAVLTTVLVPQSLSVHRFLEVRDFEGAYAAACLGVTLSDWRSLALTAAQGMALEVAQKAAVRTKDVALIDLLNSIAARRAQMILLDRHEISRRSKGVGGGSAGGSKGAAAAVAAVAAEMQREGVVVAKDALFLAELLAFQGRFSDAAKAFAKAGHMDRATDLFADLRRWDDALLFAATAKDQTSDANKELIRRQAEWNEEVGDWVRAAEMFMKCGDPGKAVRLLGDKQPSGWPQLMATIASDLPTTALTPRSSSSSSSPSSASFAGDERGGDNNRPTLLLCARYLSEGGEDDRARNVYEKLDAVKELMALLMARHKWPEAVALADDPKNKGKFDDSMFEPYAQWLALHDRFDEALAAYRRAGRPDESFRMMEQLTFNAVREGRFKDAAFYYLLLSNEVLKPRPKSSGHTRMPTTTPASSAPSATDEAVLPQQQQPAQQQAVKRGGRRGNRNESKEEPVPSKPLALPSSSAATSSPSSVSSPPTDTRDTWEGPSASDEARHCEYIRRAKIYFAYQRIEDLFQPFTSSHPEANFQVAQHLINALGASSSGGDSSDALVVVPHGVSLVRVLHTLAKNAKELGAYKLSRHAYDKLHGMVLPESERDAVEMDMLAIQAKPLRDKPELLPVCFISGQPSPLLNPVNSGDVSLSGCGHPFVRSMGSFEVLPLVEFCPAPGLTDDEAIDLIRTALPSPGGGKLTRNWGGSGANVMSMDDEGGGNEEGPDLFHRAINRALSVFEHLDGQGGGESKAAGGSRAGGGDRNAGGYVPVLCDADCLLSLKRDEVFCLRPRLELALLKTSAAGRGSSGSSSQPTSDSKAELQAAVKGLGGAGNREGGVGYSGSRGRGVQYCRFFRNMLGSDAPVGVSQAAGQFFMEEDLELALLKEGQCPFSRQSAREMRDYGAL